MRLLRLMRPLRTIRRTPAGNLCWLAFQRRLAVLTPHRLHYQHVRLASGIHSSFAIWRTDAQMDAQRNRARTGMGGGALWMSATRGN